MLPRLLPGWLRHPLRSLHERRRRRKMEITSANFRQRLPDILESIRSAQFVAVDGEFTGVAEGLSAMDTPAERYAKAYTSATRHQLLQFGLCTFHYNEKEDKYTNRAYNFYVWPHRCPPGGGFYMQHGSVQFLSKQNFDFNKVIRQGVSYIRPDQEQTLRKSLMDRQEQRRQQREQQGTPNANREDIAIPEEQKDYVKKVHEKIDLFLRSQSNLPFIELGKSNSFQRKLVYQTVRKKYKDVHLESVTKPSRERVLRASKATESEKKMIQEAKDQEEVDDLSNDVGFTKVVQMLSESRKVIVGHNMILDVLHTLHQFVAPLPADYASFKKLTQDTFPHLVDTKLMSSTQPFKDEIPSTTLEDLRATVGQSPYEMPEVGPAERDAGYAPGADKYHEAGYDAYVTGLVFIALSNRLGALMTNPDAASLASRNSSKFWRVPPTSPLLRPFLNKLFVMRVQDISYMNLAGPDLEVDREHVFHVRFPEEWKTSDLCQLFSAFGPVHVSWLDSEQAFVALKMKDNAKHVLSTLNCSSVYSLTPYKQYKSLERMSNEYSGSGITPMFEKANLSFSTPPPLHATPPARQLHTKSASALPEDDGAASASTSSTKRPKPELGRKRSASPDVAALKRSKSVTEDNGAGVGSGPSGGVSSDLVRAIKEEEVAEAKKTFEVDEDWD